MSPKQAIPTLTELKALDQDSLEAVAEDVRQAIIQTCLSNGGHLGASLGAVELAIAVHHVFDSPSEPIVWDVGHQAYAHKLLTGRAGEFHTLRRQGGLAGFLSRDESEHDVWGAGHSSTALSAALAAAWARGGSADPEMRSRWTVAVVGDGGLTAGLALEALNNVRAQPIAPLLLLLNDNQMSIAPNVGALSGLLSDGRARQFFDCFGFDYVGPVNGHDLSQLIGTLRGIRENYAGRPVVVHALTQKGKGYPPAEERPEAFHGVSPVSSGKKAAQMSWSDCLGETLCKLAANDPRIVAITAAMPEGTGLQTFAKTFPGRFFDVGIAEQHAVTFAAGLSAQGYLPVVAIYSTFLQRALDSVIHDVALQRLPVCFAIDRAGLVGADGATHHGVFDLAYLGPIPGMELYSPAVYDDLELLLSGWSKSPRLMAMRYPRGGGHRSLPRPRLSGELEARVLRSDASAQRILIALGTTLHKAIRASDVWWARGIPHELWSVTRVKPLPRIVLERLAKSPDLPVYVIEDASRTGGFGSSLRDALESRVKTIAYPDLFVGHGTVEELETALGISSEDVSAL